MIVRTPVEGFSGVVAGVEFADGAGETSDPGALAYFRRHGYKVEDEPEQKPARRTAKKAAPKPSDDE